MSVLATQQSDALVVRPAPSGREGFVQLMTMLGNVAHLGHRVVLDLSEHAMAPRSRIRELLEHLIDLRQVHGADIVLVAERATARRPLRTLVPEPAVPVVASLAMALQHESA